MFGFGDAVHVRRTAKATGQLLVLLDTARIVRPPRFWQDAYALGFLYGTASMLLRADTHNAVTGNRADRIVIKAIEQIAGPYKALMRVSLDHFLRVTDDSFIDAAHKASDLVEYAWSGRNTVQSVDFEYARSQGILKAQAKGRLHDEEEVSACIYHELVSHVWYKPVELRLSALP